MRVLIACEYSGRMRRAFAARGHDVVSCDFLPSEDNSPDHVQGDVFELIKPGVWDLMIAHPPCTYLANSGVRWLREKSQRDTWRTFGPTKCPVPVNEARWSSMLDAAEFFAFLLQAPIPKVAVENPVMHCFAREAIARRMGLDEMPPTHFVQPWWFGDPAFKATGFTLKGLAPLEKPATALVPPKKGTQEHKDWSVIHMASPGKDRWKERSRTFPGIAQAAAEAWG